MLKIYEYQFLALVVENWGRRVLILSKGSDVLFPVSQHLISSARSEGENVRTKFLEKWWMLEIITMENERAEEVKLTRNQALLRPRMNMLTKDTWWPLSVEFLFCYCSFEALSTQAQWKDSGTGKFKIFSG